MLTTPPTQKEKLSTLQKEFESKISQFENPTQNNIDNLLLETQIDKMQLVYLSGHYVINNLKAKGFVSINTTNYKFEVQAKNKVFIVKIPVINISVSLDGKTSKEFTFEDITFYRNNLIIDGYLDINFSRKYNIGKIVSFSGTIQTQSEKIFITGATYFNSVPLKAFSGTYRELTGFTVGNHIMRITDSSLVFDFGDGPVEITEYIYKPSVCTLEFYKPKSVEKFEVLLGLSGNSGLACNILSKHRTRFAVTIPMKI